MICTRTPEPSASWETLRYAALTPRQIEQCRRAGAVASTFTDSAAVTRAFEYRLPNFTDGLQYLDALDAFLSGYAAARGLTKLEVATWFCTELTEAG